MMGREKMAPYYSKLPAIRYLIAGSSKLPNPVHFHQGRLTMATHSPSDNYPNGCSELSASDNVPPGTADGLPTHSPPAIIPAQSEKPRYRFKDAIKKMGEIPPANETAPEAADTNAGNETRANKIERLAKTWLAEKEAAMEKTEPHQNATIPTDLAGATNIEPRNDVEATASNPINNDLPRILLPEGAFALRLKETEFKAYGDPVLNELHRKITYDLERMRYKTSSSSLSSSGQKWEDTDTSPLMPSYNDGGGANHLLRFCIAFHEKFSHVAGKLHDEAWRDYVDKKCAYDLVLGDLIPGDFIKSAEDYLKRRAYRQGTNATAADDFPIFREHLETRRQEPLSTITTGLPELDACLGGGLQGLTFLGGPTNVGKTSFAQYVATSALEKHKKLAVLIVSFDMVKAKLLQRFLCREADVAWRTLEAKDWSPEVCSSVREAEKRLLADLLKRLRIVELGSLPQTGFTAQWLLDIRNEIVSAAHAERALIIIDNFQRLPIENATNDLQADGLRLDQIKAMQDATRTAIQPEGDTILVISKIPKDAGKLELETDDLQGSSDLGSRASCVMFLKKVEPKPDANVEPVVLSITKGRDGVELSRLHLNFHYSTYQFEVAKTKQKMQATAGKRSSKKTSSRPSPYAGTK
jgi:RecA/RadA recombinase